MYYTQKNDECVRCQIEKQYNNSWQVIYILLTWSDIFIVSVRPQSHHLYWAVLSAAWICSNVTEIIDQLLNFIQK